MLFSLYFSTIQQTGSAKSSYYQPSLFVHHQFSRYSAMCIVCTWCMEAYHNTVPPKRTPSGTCGVLFRRGSHASPLRSSSSELKLLSPMRGATCLALASLSLAVPLRWGLLWWSHLPGSGSHCRVMTMTLVCNLDDDLRFGGVCGASVGCQGGYVCPCEGRVPWWSVRVFVSVLAGFPLINRPPIFHY
jgi:hypothetical protein